MEKSNGPLKFIVNAANSARDEINKNTAIKSALV
jgi:hypothetical protein